MVVAAARRCISARRARTREIKGTRGVCPGIYSLDFTPLAEHRARMRNFVENWMMREIREGVMGNCVGESACKGSQVYVVVPAEKW